MTQEQADAFKSVVDKIVSAPHHENEATKEEEPKAPEGKTEMLNLVLESLPEPEAKAKPKRRRVTSATRAPAPKNEGEI